MKIMLGTANISKEQIQIKLNNNYAKLEKIDQEELTKNTIEHKDFIEKSTIQVDKNDYERVLEKFKSMDSNIRTHEQLHASLAQTSGAITYTYQIGPDGKMYVNGGHVRLDTSMPSDPKEASFKLDKIKSAALAPDGLSGADASIARDANLMKMKLAILEENQDNS